ncbi:hypothetical protein ABH927_006896 [Planotetraspora sp. GP83]
MAGGSAGALQLEEGPGPRRGRGAGPAGRPAEGLRWTPGWPSTTCGVRIRRWDGLPSGAVRGQDRLAGGPTAATAADKSPYSSCFASTRSPIPSNAAKIAITTAAISAHTASASINIHIQTIKTTRSATTTQNADMSLFLRTPTIATRNSTAISTRNQRKRRPALAVRTRRESGNSEEESSTPGPPFEGGALLGVAPVGCACTEPDGFTDPTVGEFELTVTCGKLLGPDDPSVEDLLISRRRAATATSNARMEAISAARVKGRAMSI